MLLEGKMAVPTALVVLVMLMMEAANSQTCSREEYSSMQLHFTNCTGGGGEVNEYWCCTMRQVLYGQKLCFGSGFTGFLDPGSYKIRVKMLIKKQFGSGFRFLAGSGLNE